MDLQQKMIGESCAFRFAQKKQPRKSLQVLFSEFRKNAWATSVVICSALLLRKESHAFCPVNLRKCMNKISRDLRALFVQEGQPRTSHQILPTDFGKNGWAKSGVICARGLGGDQCFVVGHERRCGRIPAAFRSSPMGYRHGRGINNPGVERHQNSLRYLQSSTVSLFLVGGGAGAWSILIILFGIDDPLVSLGGWRRWHVERPQNSFRNLQSSTLPLFLVGGGILIILVGIDEDLHRVAYATQLYTGHADRGTYTAPRPRHLEPWSAFEHERYNIKVWASMLC